jgi:excisionase family DNA binding protein
MLPRLLTTQEVAVILNVPRGHIYRLLKRGRLPAVRIGREWRFDERELSRWLRRGGIASRRGAEGGGQQRACEANMGV